MWTKSLCLRIRVFRCLARAASVRIILTLDPPGWVHCEQHNHAQDNDVHVELIRSIAMQAHLHGGFWSRTRWSSR